MRQYLLLLMACFLGICRPGYAANTDITDLDNVLYINPVTATAGTQYTLSVRMKNTVIAESFGFDLVLPEGITVATDENGFALASLSTERTNDKKTNHFDCNFKLDGSLNVQAYSSNGSAIEGNDGEVALIVIDIASSVTVGTYPICLRNIAIADINSVTKRTDLIETSITITGVDDGRLKFYETSATLPSYTVGEKADVTMQRTIKAGEWSTLVLPFTLTKAKAEAAFGSDVQLAEFAGFEVEYADEDDVTPDAITINLSDYTMTTKRGLTGGKPFFIKTSRDIETIIADDVTLAGTVADVSKADEYDTPGRLTGTLTKTTIPEDGLFLSGNRFWYSTGKTNVKAFRCWLELGAVLDKETDFGARIKLHFNDENEASGIRDNKRPTASNSRYYDLQGRAVAAEKSPSLPSSLRKGVYVKDGKKIVVK